MQREAGRGGFFPSPLTFLKFLTWVLPRNHVGSPPPPPHTPRHYSQRKRKKTHFPENFSQIAGTWKIHSPFWRSLLHFYLPHLNSPGERTKRGGGGKVKSLLPPEPTGEKPGESRKIAEVRFRENFSCRW